MTTENPFQSKLESGKFVVTGELAPPKSGSRETILRKARHLKAFDAVNITDNQLAVCRMSPLAVAAVIIQEGITPIPQFTLRDRNSLGLQSDLFGAYALGVRNIFCLTGDHPRHGNHPDAKPVFEMTVLDFMRKVRTLCEKGEYFSGDPILIPPGVLPKFFIGGACNPIDKSGRPGSIERLIKKNEAGARFFQTQPIFDVDAFSQWMEKVRAAGLHKRARIIAGAMPLRSMKGALHIARDVPGNFVPEAVVKRMEKAGDPAAEGKKICVEILRALRKIEGVAGVHLMSVAWEEALPEVAEEAGLL